VRSSAAATSTEGAAALFMASPPRALHRFAAVTAAVTLLMVVAGAWVTSRDAGLSIPDPVTNHGGILPAEQLADGYRDPSGRLYSGGDVGAEFFHRAVGWTLGALALGLAIAIHRADPRAWMRRLSYGGLGLVALQGVVGALGVKLRQPALLVVPHALLAQAFLCVALALAYFTSLAGASPRAVSTPRAGRLRAGLAALTGLLFLQLALGALVRHSEADPSQRLVAIAPHGLAALAILGLTLRLSLLALESRDRAPWLARSLRRLGALLLLQILLGVLALGFGRPKGEALERSLPAMLFPTLHVALGACILAGSFLLTLRIWRATGPEAALVREGAPA
jgi:heme A synthase